MSMIILYVYLSGYLLLIKVWEIMDIKKKIIEN